MNVSQPKGDRMPAIFVGHGNPMNALDRNRYTEGWSALGRAMPLPRAILAVSAHWYAPGTAVTAMARPRTIHDFGGFPSELYRVQYPASGDLDLAQRVCERLAPVTVELDQGWGLDHGTWSVLVHMFPEANVPVVQLRIDETQPGPFHLDIGRRLAPLREQGILIVGSGNLVHNLHAYSWGRHPTEPYDWALRFEQQVRDLIAERQEAQLAAYETLGRDALLSVPTPDHYLPLMYVLGGRHDQDAVSFPITGVDGGSVSMLSLSLG